MDNGRVGEFLKGFLIGGIAGAIAGIIYAPKSGRETREDISRKSDELIAKAKAEYDVTLEKTKKSYDGAIKKLKELEEEALQKVNELEGKFGGLTERGKEAIEDNKSRLKRAFDAGVETYKEEKPKKSS